MTVAITIIQIYVLVAILLWLYQSLFEDRDFSWLGFGKALGRIHRPLKVWATALTRAFLSSMRKDNV